MPNITIYLDKRTFSIIEKNRGEMGLSRYVKNILAERFGITLEIAEQKCMRCTHAWETRVEAPMFCPACKSPGWRKEAISKTLYPQLSDLKQGESCILPWDGVPDPRPLRAVNYQRRKYKKKLTTIPTAKGLSVYRAKEKMDEEDIAI